MASKPKKTYKKPMIQPLPLSEQAAEYIKTRGISEATASAYRLGVDEKGNLIFPFYDEENKHIFSKFRYSRKLKKGEPKAWREADTKPILFGMHLCEYTKPLCITEGEFDAMVCHESGIPNAVSVPSGSEDFTWLDTCWNFINKFENIYLFGDADAPGLEMLRKLTAKLSHKKIYMVEHECKDANELLFKRGKQAVLNCWAEAKEIPISGLVKLADVKPLDVKNMPKVRTSISRLNQLLGGFNYGSVTLLTGKRGEGKSTLMSQFLLDAIEEGNRVCAYSGELRADQFQYWADLQAAGSENIKEYYDAGTKRTIFYVDKPKREQIHAWYGDNYWLYDNSVTTENEEISVLKIFELAAKRYDCKVFAIDNLMTVDYAGISERDFYQRQSKFVQQVVNFAKLHDAHVFLVAHPRKTDKDITNDDISGSADITNRVDNVISLARQYNDNDVFDSVLTITKNRWEGTLDAIGLSFDKASRRLYSPSDEAICEYGWLDNPPQESAVIGEDLPW